MKKLLWIIILAIVGIAGYAWYDKDFRNIILQKSGVKPVKSKVYKWQDKDGQWHITNQPPPPGTPYTEQEYLHNTNVIPATPQENK